MSSQETQALERFTQARIWAAFKAPYLATALFALNPKIIKPPTSDNCETFPADSEWNIHIDLANAVRTPIPEFGWWLLHQVSHLCRYHAARVPYGLNEVRWWSLAADAEVNDDLETLNIPAPPNVVSPESLGLPVGRIAEEYLSYIEVLDEADALEGVVHCNLQADSSSNNTREVEKELLLRRIAQDIEKHRAGLGEVPGGWQRWATEQLKPAVDWRNKFRAIVRRSLYHSIGRLDFSYRRPSRRQSFSQVIFPTMIAPEPRIAVVIDTSGSISNTQLGMILAEANPILQIVRRLYVICCDTQAYPVQIVRRLTDVELTGGGGTDLRAGIDAAVQLRPQVNVIVILTDGNTPWPEQAPQIPVVIALYQPSPENPLPAWGRIVKLGEKN